MKDKAFSRYSSVGLGAIVLALISPLRPALGAVDDVVGHYEGAWTNTTFGSFGDAIIDIEATGTNASLTFDMDGFVFGMFDPPVLTMPGTVQENVILIDNQGVGQFGDIIGELDTTQGSLSVVITNVPAPNIDYVTVSGSTTNDVLDLDYRVFFPPGSIPPFADGVMVAVRVEVLAISRITVSGTNVVLEWNGGVPPFTIQSRSDLVLGDWSDAGGSTSNSFVAPFSPSGNTYFRVEGQ